ncbi:hypothetical protein SY88_23870 [Clostridiales bacterium PH28_bin88]|nr:hypothetical protein SY88_23870 [Clostridiales bacterium PH28_bin88]
MRKGVKPMIKRKITIIMPLIMVIFVFSGCAPSEAAIQTAIAATGSAGEAETEKTSAPARTRTPRPTRTITATVTLRPTATEKPTEIPTATKTNEELEKIIKDGIEALLMTFLEQDINIINLIRIEEDIIQVELKTKRYVRDSQPDISYKVVQQIATFAGLWEKENSPLKNLFPDGFNLSLLTYSAEGNYPYDSFTNFETLLDVDKKNISYQEWVELANAGFK